LIEAKEDINQHSDLEREQQHHVGTPPPLGLAVVGKLYAWILSSLILSRLQEPVIIDPAFKWPETGEMLNQVRVDKKTDALMSRKNALHKEEKEEAVGTRQDKQEPS